MRSHFYRWLSCAAAAFVSLWLLAPSTMAQPRRVPPRVPVRQVARPPAQKRILVERFSGPQAARVRAGLMADLADHAETLTLIADSEMRGAAQQAGIARVRSEADYAAVAQQLNVAIFVDGRVARRGRTWALTIRVRNGADGRILGSETWSGGTMNALGSVRRNGHSRLAQYFDTAASPGPAQPEQVAVAETAPAPWYQQEGNDGDEEERPDDDDDDDEDAAVGANRYSAFRIGLGAGTVWRSMSTEVIPLYGATGSETEGPAEARSYLSAGLGHGELAIDAEVFPGAFGGQPFPYIGLAFSYRASVGLQSTGLPPDTCRLPSGELCPDVVVNSSQSEFYLGARGRYAFGGPAHGPALDFDLGYGYFGFSLDLVALEKLDPASVIPPVGYSYLNLGVGISYPAVPTYLTLGARFAYRAGLGVSAEQKQVWGTQTGGAGGFLLGLDLKSMMPYVFEGLYVAFAFQYFSFSTTFEGDTACTTAACSAWTPGMAGTAWQPIRVPDSVGDSYVRLALSFGYEFR